MKKVEDFNANDRIDLKLIENSVHYLNVEINEESIESVIKWILYENFESSKEKLLTIYINSTGGDLYQSFALIDVMRNSKHPIRIVGLGAVMSAAFLIFVSGSKGYRFASRHTSFMCHQFSESMDNKYHDLKASMKESDSCNKRMVQILRDSTGLSVTKIKSKLLPASDVYLTAEEMVELGIADHLA